MADRTEIIRDHSVFNRHTGPLDEKLTLSLMGNFQARIERGEEPQLVDVLCAVNAADPKKLDIGDGLHRCEALRRLGLVVRVSIRDSPYIKGEVTRIRATTLNRKNAKPFELADIATTHKRDMGFETWAETAADLGWSEPTMTRVRSVNRIPASLRPMMEPLGATITQLIARIEKIEAMETAITFALGNGKPATKDEVALWIQKSDTKPKRGAKKKTLSGKIDGRFMSLTFTEEDTTIALATWLETLATKLKKFKDLPPDALGGLFA